MGITRAEMIIDAWKGLSHLPPFGGGGGIVFCSAALRQLSSCDLPSGVHAGKPSGEAHYEPLNIERGHCCHLVMPGSGAASSMSVRYLRSAFGRVSCQVAEQHPAMSVILALRLRPRVEQNRTIVLTNSLLSLGNH
eukprot:8297536-Pyramimonas_sp.AAC.1